jgi:4-amino-4-deoxy-L-arabinose transferase-like glycosyltransferase
VTGVYLKTIAAGLLVAGTCWLYARRLGDAPIYVSPDEAIIAVDAHSLASTGRDVHGVLLPLYFKIQIPGEERWGWFTPAIFYFSALFMTLLPFGESTIRLSTVVVGVTDIVLMYFLAKKLFKSRFLAALASGLLVMTPAHFILSRYGLDYLYPLPFVLAWLLCFTTFIEREQRGMLFAATAFLGFGFYSYISSVVMMPVYFLLTLLVLSQRRRPAYFCGVAAAGFGLPLLMLLLPWLVRHPSALADTAQRYGLYDSQKLNALQGLREFSSYQNLDRMASLYWSFFNPSLLFFSGDQQMMFSTRAAGVFALPMAFLIPIGIYQIVGRRRTAINLLVLAGFVTAPLAAVLVPEPAAINRAVAIMPFGALLATYGVECLWSAQLLERPRAVLLTLSAVSLFVAAAYGLKTISMESRLTRSTLMLIAVSLALFVASVGADRAKQGRALALCLLVLIPIQFGMFYVDYFTGYRLRSGPWLGGNLRGALEALINRERQGHAPFVYFSRIRSTSGMLDTSNRWMEAYWKFYLIKHGREDLLKRTVQIDTTDIRWMPPGSLVLANVGDQVTGVLVNARQLTQVELIPEVDRPGFFLILQR